MPLAHETLLSIYGAWRLARADAGAIRLFNNSVEGFWRSFTAAFLVLPLYLLLLVVRHQNALQQVPWSRFLAVEAVGYAIAWLAFPVLMVSFVKTLDRDRHYVRFIVAYNWTAVLQNGLYLPIAILTAADLIAPAVANALGLMALAVVVIYVWFVARVGLDIRPGQAASVVGLDFMLSVLINAVAEGMLH